MTLFDSFSKIEDPRRAEGQRTSLPQVFCMLVLSNLCGYHGSRACAKFSKTYQGLLTEELGLKHAPPSHVTFSGLLNRVNSQDVITCFSEWSSHYVKLREGSNMSGDGKALCSTVKDMHGKEQSFTAVVSLFCQESGLVHSLQEYRNDKESEALVVRSLLKGLKVMGLTIHLDALHTQKKLLKQ